jgi:hypothetical protein
MNTKSETSKIRQLLGCYFHQDWPDEFDNSDQAIQAIVQGEPRDQLLSAAKAIDQLLDLQRSEADWKTIMTDQLGCYFDPASEGLAYSDWLRKVRVAFLAKQLNTEP